MSLIQISSRDTITQHYHEKSIKKRGREKSSLKSESRYETFMFLANTLTQNVTIEELGSGSI
jgi:hypothetical protein